MAERAHGKSIQNRARLKEAQAACLVHASALVDSAKAVLEAGHHNIAFHLAALALEEVGKRALLFLLSLPATREDDASRLAKSLDDHVQKLFWAFFSAAFRGARPSSEDIGSMREMALRVHRTRLAGLYVDGLSDSSEVPSEAVNPAQAESLTKLAASRLDIAKAEKSRRLTKKAVEEQLWFVAFSQDENWRKFIFSGASMDKLAQLGDARAWIGWLREQQLEQEARNRALFDAEVERKGKGSGSPKWMVQIRLFSDSHTIRKKVLNKWNEDGSWIQLESTPTKNELIVKFTFPDSVAVEELWWLAWTSARRLIVALNIGTMGYFWWHRPRQVDRFYEQIRDLQQNAGLILERQPSLKVDWGENRTLSEDEIGRVARALYFFGGNNSSTNSRAAFDYYIGGLTFLSVHDIHWQCEAWVFGNFYSCLREMMIATGEHAAGGKFSEDFDKFLTQMWPEMEERPALVEWGRGIDAGKPPHGATIKQASFMKASCDAYFAIHTRDLDVGAVFGDKPKPPP